MRKFINCMLFSLLLVGWTSMASAQALPAAKAIPNGRTLKMSFTKEEIGKPATFWKAPNVMNQGQQRAPLRSQDFVSTPPTATHPKSWYQALPDVTWNGGSQNITEPFTDVNGMMALVERVYTDKDIPGYKYSDAMEMDIPYQTIEQGWDIIGTHQQDATVLITNGYVLIRQITVQRPNGTNSYDVTANANNAPSGFTSVQWHGYYYWMYDSGDGTITIPASYFENDRGYATIIVRAICGSNTVTNGMVGAGNDLYGYFGQTVTYSATAEYTTTLEQDLVGTITPPDECGSTILLVKLQDDFDQTTVPEYVSTEDSLRLYFTNYIKELQLLTDGLRVNEGGDNAGTLFAYSGDLNRFYFIGKGKMLSGSSLNKRPFDRAPFNSMYEEFSPYISGGQEDHSDLYERMRHMETYPVIHDCEGVLFMNHYFAMTGAEGDSENRVNSLVFYIPDNRGNSELGQTYDPQHQPTVGMYIIDLSADIEPAAQTDYYTVTVSWVDDLDVITHSEGIEQTYRLYEIRYNEETGQNDTTLVYTGPNTSWNFDYPVEDSYYDLHYYVIGTPTDATNHETFYAKSNTDNVTIPGKKDFLGLQWWRYESDYVTTDGENTEVNYYRNFIAPHALSVLGHAGINAENVGTEGRTLTLYRKYGNTEIPIFDLELIMDGNRAYYRIKYINRDANQQVEPGYDPNTGERTSTNN